MNKEYLDNMLFQEATMAKLNVLNNLRSEIIMMEMSNANTNTYRTPLSMVESLIKDINIAYVKHSVDEAKATERRTVGYHDHLCSSCSPDGFEVGKGCSNCRYTGYNQTPCLTCDKDK